MTGDELITYGFRRVLEELEKLNTSLNMVGEELRNVSTAMRRSVELTEKVEANTYMTSSSSINTEAAASNIQNLATITEVAVLEIKKQLKDGQHGTNTGQEDV